MPNRKSFSFAFFTILLLFFTILIYSNYNHIHINDHSNNIGNVIKDYCVKDEKNGMTKCLPDVINIGGQKCGTTALLGYFGNHPDLAAAAKEVHYWDYNYGRGLNWYRDQMKPIYLNSGNITVNNNIIIINNNINNKKILFIEKSPSYVAHPKVPMRLSGAMPNVRLLLFLRNPMSRFESQYHHKLQSKTAPQLDKLIESEIKDAPMLLAELAKCYEDESDEYCNFDWKEKPGFLSNLFRHTYDEREAQMNLLLTNMYAVRGIYSFHLQYWFQKFNPNQFGIGFFEDMIQNPNGYVNDLNKWLGVSSNLNHGLTASKVKPSGLTQFQQDTLNSFYRQYNNELQQLLVKNKRALTFLSIPSDRRWSIIPSDWALRVCEPQC